MTKKDKNEIEVVKINIISKNEEIVNSFLKNKKATLLKKRDIGLDFAVLLFNEKRFQFWITNDELDDNRSLHFNGSDTIVYFYSVDEIMNEEYLKFLKIKLKSLRRGFVFKIPLIFVMYGSKIPEKPENNKNLKIIREHFDSFNSMYVNENDQKKMMKIFLFIALMNEM